MDKQPQLLFPEKRRLLMLFDSSTDSLPQNSLMRENVEVHYCSPNPYQHFLYPSLHTFISFLTFPPFSHHCSFLSFSFTTPVSITIPSLPTFSHLKYPLPPAACRHHLNWMYLVWLVRHQQKVKVVIFISPPANTVSHPGCGGQMLDC